MSNPSSFDGCSKAVISGLTWWAQLSCDERRAYGGLMRGSDPRECQEIDPVPA